jgi:hypothetical protein
MFVCRERLRPRPFGPAKQAPSRNAEISPLSILFLDYGIAGIEITNKSINISMSIIYAQLLLKIML